MGAVHLRMMKLEGDGQLISESPFAIFPSVYAAARVVSLGRIVCAMFASCSEWYVSLVMFCLAVLVFSFCCCPAPRYRAMRFSIQLFVKVEAPLFLNKSIKY